MKKSITLLCLLVCLSFSNLSNAQTEPYIGQITMFAGNFAPRGWALCDGQLLPIAQNTALFSILGTTYGGDGETTFGLPDLRGRVPMHAGSGPGLTPRPLGQKSGTETNTITVNNMPAHSHTINAVSGEGDSSSPTNNYPADTKLLDKEYATGGTATTMNANVVGNTGNGQTVNNIQPYQTVNYIIALVGVYPSEN